MDNSGKLYNVGDRLIIEVEVTDENKSFDCLGKAVLGKIDTSHLGFEVQKVSFWKDRYIANIPIELRSEIVKKLESALNEIKEMTKPNYY